MMKKPITAELIFRLVSYTTAGIISAVGIMVLGGFIIPEYVPQNFRIMMGTVMLVYGAYRIAMLTMKRRRAHDADE